MKILIRSLLLILFVEILLPRCANPGRPSGGPKDTIPPELITSTPTIGEKNFGEQEITLEFNELINADKLQQQLIITPRTDISFKSIVKREKLIIKLSEKLKDSTTYNFNFAAGVTDITEKNPVLNLSIAFSTGPTIDSMLITGKVEDLLTQQPAEKYLVGLYPQTDSLDFLTDKPLYFTSTQDSGTFKINYVKPGSYRLLSFEDKNNNQTLDPQDEKHAFRPGIIHLDTPVHIKQPIRSLLQNVKPIQVISVRPAGLYVEVKANKFISTYEIHPKEYYHNIIGEKSEAIRIYKPESKSLSDSLLFQIVIKDSLGNVAYDTTKLTFLPSNRKPAELSIKKQQEQILWGDSLSSSLKFNKPIIQSNLDSVLLSMDSTATIAIPAKLAWNYNLTEVDINITIDSDSILATLAKLLPPDTVKLDTLGNTELRPKTPDQLIGSIPLTLQLKEKAFISVENDTTTQISSPIARPTAQKGGTLIIKLNTDHPSFIFQLMSGEVPKYQVTNETEFTLQNIKPGKYRIRVLIDSNQDGKWSYGNLLQDIEPEEIYLYPEEIPVRENWVNERTISF